MLKYNKKLCMCGQEWLFFYLYGSIEHGCKEFKE